MIGILILCNCSYCMIFVIGRLHIGLYVCSIVSSKYLFLYGYNLSTWNNQRFVLLKQFSSNHLHIELGIDLLSIRGCHGDYERYSAAIFWRRCHLTDRDARCDQWRCCCCCCLDRRRWQSADGRRCLRSPRSPFDTSGRWMTAPPGSLEAGGAPRLPTERRRRTGWTTVREEKEAARSRTWWG